MIFTQKIHDAINLSILVHEGHQKQKRRGKDVPYITHPLVVGMILSRAGASEDLIVSGILHDTIEDSIPTQKITRTMLEEKFGAHVAELVDSVTEDFDELSWEKKKQGALLHMKDYSLESMFLKSADVIANASETLADHNKIGDEIFSQFGGGKTRFIEHMLSVISLLKQDWRENPLWDDLELIEGKFRAIASS